MKILKFLIFPVVFLIIGYLAGSFFPFTIFFGNNGISGEAELQVTVLRENGSPLQNLEVDVAKVPGPPPAGGVAETNQDGLAVFNLEPGNYFIFFNANNFPNDLQTEIKPIQVKKGINKTTIILKKK